MVLVGRRECGQSQHWADSSAWAQDAGTSLSVQSDCCKWLAVVRCFDVSRACVVITLLLACMNRVTVNRGWKKTCFFKKLLGFLGC